MQMQSSNNRQMIISEHKRTSYDKDGSVSKVDILRSIRRKDAQPSFLPSLLNENEKQQNLKYGQSKFKEVIEYLLIGTIIFCSFLLIMSYCGISLQLTDSVPEQKQQLFEGNEKNRMIFQKFDCRVGNCGQHFNNETKFNIQQGVMSHFISQFSKTLQQTKEDDTIQQGGKKVKLSKLRQVMKMGDDKRWRDMLLLFAENLNCWIELNKIICQHELEV